MTDDLFSWDDFDSFEAPPTNPSALHDLSELLQAAPDLLRRPLTATYAVAGHPAQALPALQEAGFSLSSVRGASDLTTYLWYLRDLADTPRRAYIAFEFPARPDELLKLSIV